MNLGEDQLFSQRVLFDRTTVHFVNKEVDFERVALRGCWDSH